MDKPAPARLPIIPDVIPVPPVDKSSIIEEYIPCPTPLATLNKPFSLITSITELISLLAPEKPFFAIYEEAPSIPDNISIGDFSNLPLISPAAKAPILKTLDVNFPAPLSLPRIPLPSILSVMSTLVLARDSLLSFR